MPSFAVCATHETYAGQNMRFAAVVRAFVPLVSGILRMSPLQFYAANILSALAWAPAHIFPGVLLAMALQLTIPSAEQRTILVFAGLVVATFIIFATRSLCGVSNRNWLPALIQINNVRYRTFIFILTRLIH
jgi:membrane protein DedA with SNARE-associated domain